LKGLVHTGKVSSIEEFAEKTTQYSQERSQHPITVEAVKVEGELRGLRFHLSDDPHHRTSGKYLAAHLKCENNYTPSRLARSLGISSQSQQSDGFESDLGAPNNAPKIQATLPVKEEFTLDLPSSDLPDQNGSFSGVEIDEDWDTVVVPIFTRAQPQVRTGQSEQDDENASEAYDFDDVMSGDDSVFSEDSELMDWEREDFAGTERSDSLAAIDALKQPIPEPDSSGHSGYNPYLGHPAEELADLSGRANTVGSDVNGLNLLGLAGQAIALGSAVAENASNAIRLHQAERATQAAYEWMQSLVDRYEQIQVQNTQNHVEAAAIRVDDLAERVNQIQLPQNSEETLADLSNSGATSPGMPFIPPEASAEDERAEVETTEMLATGAAGLTNGVNHLSQRLQVEGEPIAPLRFDPDERISKRLSRIEDYLQQINQRLDALETIVQQLEKQVELPSNAPEMSSMPEEDATVISHQTWGMTCGKQILGYSEAVNQAIGNAPDEPGVFDLSKSRSANIERSQNNIQITVEDDQGNELYCANTSGLKWIIESNDLHSDDDIRLITSLPQTQQDYQFKQVTQDFIAKLEELHPIAFRDREPFSILASTAQEPSVTQPFKDITFEVTEQSGNAVLRGLGKTGDPMLIAQHQEHEQDWEIELCKLSPDAMNAVIQQQDDSITEHRPRSTAQSSSSQTNATERQRKEQLEQ
jgi:hypothetical protein